MRLTTKTLAFLLSASLAACAGQAEVRSAGNASNPELVEMDGDSSVLVVANSEEPVFYSESTYWLYRDHAWYRSASYRDGWSRVEQPPDHVRRIHEPTAFVHYRGGEARTRTTYNQQPSALPRQTPSRNPRPPRETRDPVDRPLPEQRVAPTPERPPITPEQQDAQRRDRLEPTREVHDRPAPQATNPNVPPPPRPEPAKEPAAVDGNDRPPLTPLPPRSETPEPASRTGVTRASDRAPTGTPTASDRSEQLVPQSSLRAPQPRAQAVPNPPVAPPEDRESGRVAPPDSDRSPLSGQPAPRPDQRPEAVREDGGGGRAISPPEVEPRSRQFDSY